MTSDAGVVTHSSSTNIYTDSLQRGGVEVKLVEIVQKENFSCFFFKYRKLKKNR